jgi:hypothetical protein
MNMNKGSPIRSGASLRSGSRPQSYFLCSCSLRLARWSVKVHSKNMKPEEELILLREENAAFFPAFLNSY